MAPFGNFLFSGLVEQSAKESNLTVVYTAEQSSWVGIPPALAGKLLDRMPLTLRLQLFAAHAVPVGSPYYLAWSGTVSESGKLSLSSQLGRLLPLPEGATVRIESRPTAGSLIHSFTHSSVCPFFLRQVVVTPMEPGSVLPATRVTLAPASSDDWEVVELNADEIEGRLLEQTGVVSANRELPIWVSGQMMALKVASTEPAADVVRLVAGTEVSIAPRPRKAAAAGGGRDAEALLPVYLRVHLSESVEGKTLKSSETPSGFGGENLNDGPTMYLATSTLEGLRETGHRFRAGSIVSVCSGAKYKSDMLARIEVMDGLPRGHAVFEASMEPTLKRYAIRESHRVQVKVKKGANEFPPMFLDAFSRRDGWIGNGNDDDKETADKKGEMDADEGHDGETLDRMLEVALPILSAKCRPVLQRWKAPRRGGILLEGAAGSGKTAAVNALCKRLSEDVDVLAATKYIDCKSVPSAKTFSQMLHFTLSWAKKTAPAVIVLDNLDVALTEAAQDEAGHDLPHDPDVVLLVRFLAEGMDSVTRPSDAWMGWPPIVFVATCRDATKLPKSIRAIGRLDTLVRVTCPDLEGRMKIIQTKLGQRKATATTEDLRAVGAELDGFTASDIGTLVERIISLAFKRTLGWEHGVEFPLRVTLKDLQGAIDGMVPQAMWGSKTKKKLEGGVEGWQDVGGLRDVKQALSDILELPLLHPDLVASCPLRLQTGALLYGLPGSGKSHVVAAAIAASDIRCIVVSGPELLNKYIGASEAAVRDVFQRAATAAPCVLFFDEMDALAPRRGHDNTGVSDRVVNQLLTELDGVEGLKGVVVIGATSRPDLIDPALLRPGRLDNLLFCDFPDAADRVDIMRCLSRKLHMGPDVDLVEIASDAVLEGYSGADLGAILADAQLFAAHEALELNETSGLVISRDHITRALETSRPSVSERDARRLEAVYAKFRQGGGVDEAELRQGQKVSFA